MSRELTREEKAAIRSLVVKWCANYDRECGCLPLDCDPAGIIPKLHGLPRYLSPTVRTDYNRIIMFILERFVCPFQHLGGYCLIITHK